MSTDSKKEAARRRQQNLRDREAGRPETYPKVRVEATKRRDQNDVDVAWASEQDATGKYYKSECRSCTDLLAIYEGANILDKESDDDEDEEDDKKKKSGKKQADRPNPSVTKISIRAIEYSGVKLEPNCD